MIFNYQKFRTKIKQNQNFKNINLKKKFSFQNNLYKSNAKLSQKH